MRQTVDLRARLSGVSFGCEMRGLVFFAFNVRMYDTLYVCGLEVPGLIQSEGCFSILLFMRNGSGLMLINLKKKNVYKIF